MFAGPDTADFAEAKAWIEAHKGQWNHAEWLELLETLKRSAYWPVKPEEVGKALEELKRGWQQRN